MTAYDSGQALKAQRQNLLSAPAKGWKHERRGGGPTSLLSGGGIKHIIASE